MENVYVRLLEEFKRKLELHGFRRVEFIDRGLRAWFVLGTEPLRVGFKFHGGIWVSVSSEVCRVPLDQANLFMYGPIPKEHVCLRRVIMDPVAETPIAVRLDTSWLHDELLFQQVAWLLRCSVDARQAYERGVDNLQVWQPCLFDASEADRLFAAWRQR